MNESSDRLSGLPEHLILVILSFLPLKSAIATSVLSRQWQWLWTHLSNIDLYLDNDNGSFGHLIDIVLPKFDHMVRISRFSLCLHHKFFKPINDRAHICSRRIRVCSHIVSCFDWVIKKRCVQELIFTDHRRGLANASEFQPIPLPVFQITSLVVLELCPWLFIHDNLFLHEDADLFHLPNLKKLTVRLYCRWNPRILGKLVSSCPSLEHLSFGVLIIGTKNTDTLYLSSPTLKCLDMLLQYDILVIVVNAPNLEHLFIYAMDDLTYRISFDNPPTALRDCLIRSRSKSLDDIFMPSNFFHLISGVISLAVDVDKAIPHLAPMSSLPRLTHLKLTLQHPLSKLALLQQCPVLEVLTLDFITYPMNSYCSDSLPDSTPQCILTCVKRIEIQIDQFLSVLVESLLLLLKYFLGCAQALEVLRINITCPKFHDYKKGRTEELNFIKELFEAPKCSARCTVEFYGLHRRVSNQILP